MRRAGAKGPRARLVDVGARVRHRFRRQRDIRETDRSGLRVARHRTVYRRARAPVALSKTRFEGAMARRSEPRPVSPVAGNRLGSLAMRARTTHFSLLLVALATVADAQTRKASVRPPEATACHADSDCIVASVEDESRDGPCCPLCNQNEA